MERAIDALVGLREVLRNENLRRVELAWGAAIAAEWAHFVAFGIFAYDEGGAVGVGIAGVVRMLPAAIAAPFAASLGDRFRRERFLLANALVGCAALAASTVAFLAGSVVLVFAFAAVVGLASTLFRPALQALLPSLARTPEELIASNGATSTLEGLGTLVGPLVAGVLVALMDVGLAFAVGAFAFLVAAVLLARVKVEGRIRVTAAAGESTVRLLLGGFRAVARRPKPRLVIGLVLAQTFVRGCLNVLIVVAAFRVLDAGAGAVGYMTAAIGVGGLIGAVGAVTLEPRRLAETSASHSCSGGSRSCSSLRGRCSPWRSPSLAVVGAANSVEDVAMFTLIQRIVPDELLTRVLGVLWGLAMGGVALGSLAAPALVSVIGPRPAFVAVGAILPLLTLLTWRRLVEIDRSTAAPATELALIAGEPMFAPLPLAAKEHMAASLVPVAVAAGEVLITAGDPGDRFYIVDEGEFEISAEGLDARAHEGDHFGEIALLRDIVANGDCDGGCRLQGVGAGA